MHNLHDFLLVRIKNAIHDYIFITLLINLALYMYQIIAFLFIRVIIFINVK